MLRFGCPWPGFTPCTWLTTLRREDLIERACVLPSAKMSEIDDVIPGITRPGTPWGWWCGCVRAGFAIAGRLVPAALATSRALV